LTRPFGHPLPQGAREVVLAGKMRRYPFFLPSPPAGEGGSAPSGDETVEGKAATAPHPPPGTFSQRGRLNEYLSLPSPLVGEGGPAPSGAGTDEGGGGNIKASGVELRARVRGRPLIRPSGTFSHEGRRKWRAAGLNAALSMLSSFAPLWEKVDRRPGRRDG